MMNSTWQRTPSIRCFAIAIMFVYGGFCSRDVTSGGTLWSYLAQHNTTVELMDITPGENNFFLAGVRNVVIPWETDSTATMKSIIPPLQRKILLVLKANNNAQNILWYKEFANLPDVNEVYSIAVTNDQQLCVVYGGEPLLDSAINPLVLRLDRSGESLWYKPVFPPAESAISDFLPNEHIANLDAINVTASSKNSCILTLITRTVQTNSETFRLHIIRYDNQGNINWHKALPTDIYGATYLLNNTSMREHFIVTTNLSRDAALEAMILGQPFIPQIHIATIDSEGKILHTIQQAQSLSGAWLNDVIATGPESLLLIGKKRSAWMTQIQSNGGLVNEYIDNDKIGDEFQAITKKSENGYILTHNGFISIFDQQLRLQATLDITDITSQIYENPNLSLQLPEDVAVEKLLQLNADDYLLFYKYGSRLLKISLKNQPK